MNVKSSILPNNYQKYKWIFSWKSSLLIKTTKTWIWKTITKSTNVCIFSCKSVILAAVLLTARGPPGAGARVTCRVVEDSGEPGGRSVLPLSVEVDHVTRRRSLRGWRFVTRIRVLWLTYVSGHLGTLGEIGPCHSILLRQDRWAFFLESFF